MSPYRTIQMVNLALLGLLAGLLLAVALGARVPLTAVVGLLLASTILRTYRDYRFGGEVGRRRIPFNLMVMGLVLYLLFTSSGQ
ncbi:MAG TPA: hypothetical protein VNT60_09165 [Deinococcales bacterium]|nr:hypothetical protein [Deinococcales bacterium]